MSEAKVGKNRMHIDLVVADVEAEIARLELLGAHRDPSEPFVEHETQWVVMGDPEGNEFCICKA